MVASKASPQSTDQEPIIEFFNTLREPSLERYDALEQYSHTEILASAGWLSPRSTNTPTNGDSPIKRKPAMADLFVAVSPGATIRSSEDVGTVVGQLCTRMSL